MKTSIELASEVGRAIGIRSQQSEPAELLLLRAAVEISHHSGSDGARIDEELLRLIRAVDRTVSPELVESLRDQFPPTDAAWIATLRHSPSIEANKSEAVHGYLALLTLLRLVPRSHSEARAAWRYIDGATTALHAEPQVVSNMAGWLAGSADADVASYMESLLHPLREIGPLAEQIVNGAQAHVQTAQTESAGVPLSALRMQLARAIQRTEPYLEALQVNRLPRQKLLKQLYEEHFRLAVLGEFKRGKSTLINALIGLPGLMPAAALPCTSALIELRASTVRKYEVSRTGPLGDYQSATEAEFLATAGDAAQRTSRREDVEEEAARVPYWRVQSPSKFLEKGSLAIIDSPGIGEDDARDLIAMQEAKRADAALLVLDATQPASLEEIKLIESLKDKVKDVIIAINKTDTQPTKNWEALQNHVLRKIQRHTPDLTADRIILVSALRAEQALEENRKDDIWLHRLEDLRQLIERHLVQRAGRIKKEALLRKTNTFIKEMDEAVSGSVSVRRRQLEDLANLQAAQARTKQHFEAAKAALDAGMEARRDATAVALQLKHAFFAALPALLKEAEAAKEQWTSGHNPVTSPKLHVKEVAEKARQSVLAEVDKWMRHTGGPLIAQEIGKRLSQLDQKLAAAKEYLKDATGQDPEKLLNQLKQDAAASCLSSNVDDISEGDAVMRVMIGGALASVLGYVIADVVLYYILGAISGFLNPLLLGAAAVVAVGLYWLKGEDWVRQWIRSSIAEQISSALLNKEEVRKKLGDQLENSTKEVFTKVWTNYCENVRIVLDEARRQQTSNEEWLRKYESQRGTLGSEPEEELARLASLESEARRALGALQSFVNAQASLSNS